MKNYVVCLKYGTKYPAEYVNKLYSMVSRYLTIDHEFYCITDDRNELNAKIKIIDLKLDPEITNGWWYKLEVFNPEFPLHGTILFLDLDLVIFGDMNKFFDYNKGSFCIIEKFMAHNKAGVNSSCFRFESGSQVQLYETFSQHKRRKMQIYAGDQDLIGFEASGLKHWPKNWCLSYKLHMVGNDPYNTEAQPKTYPESSIAVFHGLPNPHQVENAWCKEHWR